MQNKECINKSYDVVVVGGGISGICTAISSARHGAKVALIHNRPVLGGNASSEIRMHICGADSHGHRINARETGILEEILLENRMVNQQDSYSVFDTILWEKVHFQKNIDLFLNTHMTEVVMEDNSIKSIKAEQLTTEKKFEFQAKIYVDSTGDGTLAYLSGAEYMIGREGKEVFGEQYAPDESDNITMGNTLLFTTVDIGKPITFKKPVWANTYTEKDLNRRDHGAKGHNYWWIELGGDELDIVFDGEEIRDELLRAVYGVWDHIKNGGDHGAENYALDWIGFLPGKRESRRIVGDYILKENDLLEGKIYEDAVAYGGWPMDMHVVGGLRTQLEPTTMIELDDVYSIPYRSLYSKNIDNLMIGGRAISASHMAFGSTRVMATCAVVGQAIGTASAMAIEKGCLPRELLNYVKELQQKLLKDDAYIPGCKNEYEKDIARLAKVTASSYIVGAEPENIINGYSRKIGNDENCWISKEMQSSGEWISFEFNSRIKPTQIDIRFDSNLSNEIMLTLFHSEVESQLKGIPKELVKDYDIEFYNYDELMYVENVRDNYLRHRIHKLNNSIICNKIKIKVISTNGDTYARIFEVRVEVN